MLSREIFQIDSSFKMNNNHRIIVIGGVTGSGKTRLINEIKEFYNAYGLINLTYTFNPYNKSEQKILDVCKDEEKVVLYAEDLFSNGIDWSKANDYTHKSRFSDRMSQIKMISTHCLKTSYLPQVHKIFITTQLHCDFNFQNGTLEDKFVNSNDLIHYADLVLKLQMLEFVDDDELMHPRDLKVFKDRMATYNQSQNRTGFLKNLANSYFIRNRALLKNRSFVKYLYKDFSTTAVQTYKELFDL